MLSCVGSKEVACIRFRSHDTGTKLFRLGVAFTRAWVRSKSLQLWDCEQLKP